MTSPGPLRVTADGIAYADLGGDGPALVFIHGVGLDHAMWADLLPHMGSGWRVILVDMPGHGGSALPPEDAGLGYYAMGVLSVLEALGIARAVLVGFSMGALVARCFALEHPDTLAGLVLMSGVFNRSSEVRANVAARVNEVVQGGPGANVEAALERWFTPDWHRNRSGAVEAMRQRLHANHPQGYLITYRLFASQDNYGAPLLDQIRVPTLVITGEADIGSTPAMTRELAAHIPGAQAVVVPGARHMIPVEHPEETARHLRRFLDPLRESIRPAHQPASSGAAES